MRVERDSNTKGGFLGLANNKVKVVEQYTMDGAVHTKSTTVTEGTTKNQKTVSKQSEEQSKQEDSLVQVLVPVLLLASLIFPLLVGLLLVG